MIHILAIILEQENESLLLQYIHECLTRDRDTPELFHLFFSFFLFFEEFAFTADVATVTFGGNVLAHGTYGFAGYDFGANGGLNWDFKLLARNQLF